MLLLAQGAAAAVNVAQTSSAVSAPTLTADGQQTGTVTGRVQNVATGQFLNQARVTIKGTNQIVFTDKYGVFRLINVPSGPVALEVFYTNLDPATITLIVPPGAIVERDIDLTSVARYGKDASTVKLDAFIVTSDRETDAQAIATNEQRFAPNLKNVMSTDTLGDVLGGSVGEFLKFMPGITAEYDNVDIASISVRGIGGGMTAVTTDGAFSSNIWNSFTRAVDVRSMGLNDISRIELTKVPTPATPADSLAGSVNLVSKSAFERNGRQLRYGVNLVGNHENLTLKKTPTSFLDRNTYKILPGVNFDFTWPISKTFGLVIAGMSTNVFTEQHFTRNTWGTSGTGTNAVNASNSSPFLQTYYLFDGPRNLTRNTLSLKFDWKVTHNSVLSLSHMANRSVTRQGNLFMQLSTGTIGTPTPVNGVPMTWGPTFTRGATGRGALTNACSFTRVDQLTDTTNLTYRFDDGRWKIEGGVSRSASTTKRRLDGDAPDSGFIAQVIATNMNPVRINFFNITPDKLDGIEVFDNSGQPVEWREISNFRGTTASNFFSTLRNQYNNGYLNLCRRFDLLPFPTALQIGGSQRVQSFDTNIQSIGWTFNGPDGVSGATAPMQPYVMQVYKNMDSHYGFDGIQWLSPSRAWQAYLQNPRLYTQTLAQQFAAENSRIDGSEYIEERVQAAYIQAEATLFRSRLRVLGGVRFEKTIDDGQGAFTDADAVWLRDASGAYVRTAAGTRIRRPEAGAVNSTEQIRVTRKERGTFAHRAYDGYYPSLHLTYSTAENLLVRAAYASTYGRPNFTDIVPRVVATAADLDEEDPTPSTGRGTLTIRNPTLRPWTADNLDLSVEYYTQQGGLFSAGVFRKNIKNFFGDSSRIADANLLNELGLNQQYINWNVLTKFNAGDATINGAEFNVRQSLRGLGKWGSYFTLFANATKLQLNGGPGASFTSFIPKSGNWGGTFSGKRVTVTARWNYRGQDRRLPQAAFGPDGYEYFAARTYLDLNAAYQVSSRLSFNVSVNNLTNTPQTVLRYGSDTPAYARQYEEREFAIQMAVGLRGTF